MADTLDSVPVDTAVVTAPPEVVKAATDDLMSALNQQADQARKYYEKLAKQIKTAATSAATSLGDTNMADSITPMIMGGGGDGLFGGGAGGGGLIGGLILGSLLRQGNGGLFGGENGGAGAAVLSTENAIAAQSALTNARFDAQAQAAILAAVATGNAALGVEIAKGQGEITTQNALNAAALGVQVQKTSGETNTQLALAQAALGVQAEKTAAALSVQIATEATAAALQAAQNKYDLTMAISNDGQQTRALIIAQNDAELNRRLVIAANEITELRGDRRLGEATRGVEVTTTNNINQMQQQQQQQAQFGQLANLIYSLGQQIQSTNSAINVGSGTQTANPSNTNTNIR